MTTRDDRAQAGRTEATGPDRSAYRNLPAGIELDETVASVDADPVPDPAAGRNVDHHRALRDD